MDDEGASPPYSHSESSTKTFDAVSEIISKFSGHAFYPVYAVPAKPGRLKRTVAKHRLGTALEKSQKQHTDQGWLPSGDEKEVLFLDNELVGFTTWKVQLVDVLYRFNHVS